MKFNGKELMNYTKADLIKIILNLKESFPDESPIRELFE